MNKTSIENQLFTLAMQTRSQAYAPYSGFAVGAAIQSTSGKLYSGCNVENVSYPCGTCAEAGAIAAMLAGGDQKIEQILIIADSPELIAPCGACLQRIKEFAQPETTILLANMSGIQKKLTIEELLPFGFNNEELKK